MSAVQVSRKCSYCRRRVLAEPQQPPLLLHALLTACTFGLWFPVALYVMLAPSYRCQRCGQKV
jgi:DNA-directed RNA polymerase subunit RPC12/RpoP